MPTTSEVNTAAENFITDTDTADGKINGAAGTVTDRHGVTTKNLQQIFSEIGYKVPVAFSSGLSVSDGSFTVEYSGEVYAAKPSQTPFTTTASFLSSQWFKLENLTKFNSRNATNAAILASNSDGTVGVLGGLFYKVDSSATGTDSATNDLGVDGLVPFGDATFEHYGATGGADDVTAMNAALANGGRVRGKSGRTYSFSGTLNIVSGTVLDLRGCSLTPTSAVTGAALRAYQQSDITVYWGAVVGTGAAFSTGDENLVVFEECDRVRSYDGLFRKSRNMGILLKDCENCTIQAPVSLNCYGTGFQDRDGNNNTWINPISDGNGDTGVATYSGGRGLLIWRGTDITVLGGSSSRCSEYGLRVFSQAADTAGTSHVKVIGHHCEDNDVIDYYIYNESGDVALIEMTNCSVRRTSDPTSHPVALQGSNISWVGGMVEKVGGRAARSTFSLYGLSDSKISGVHAKNQGQFISWSGSSLCDNVLVESNVADIATCGQPLGSNISYHDNTFVHGGAGTTDIAIDCGSVTEVTVDGNRFDGFWRNINWTAQGIVLRNNTSRNTTDVSLRMNGDGVAGLASSGNDWDTGSNPSWVATAHRQKNTNSRMTAYGGAAPTTLSWARGDRIVQANPTVALPKSWVCTVSGTPGTWVSEGDL